MSECPTPLSSEPPPAGDSAAPSGPTPIIPEFHPAARLFPMMRDDELRRLADDIRKRGQQEAIVMYEGNVTSDQSRGDRCHNQGSIASKRKSRLAIEFCRTATSPAARSMSVEPGRP